MAQHVGWPEPRVVAWERQSALLTATALTVLAGALLSTAILPAVVLRDTPAAPVEAITLVALPVPVVHREVTRRPTPLRRTSSAIGAVPSSIPTAPPALDSAPSDSVASTAESTPVPPTPAASPARKNAGAALAPSAFTRTSSDAKNSLAGDNLLARLGFDLSRLRPTQAMIDSSMRADALANARSRDEHRPAPVAVSGAGGSIPFPLFSRGPSRKQRMRDSIIYAENLRLLARVMERARAKRDSLRAADSLPIP